MSMLNVLGHLPGLIAWREMSLGRHDCPVCGKRKLFVKLDARDIAIRCLGCRSSLITLSLIDTLQRVVDDLSGSAVYELSSRGTLVAYLERHCAELTCSELLDGVAPGDRREGVMCQDVQRLTFGNECFDVCTSQEVFEHVADDKQGFSEICRVLKPGGLFVFTVPLARQVKTVERARTDAGGHLQHLLTPEYHIDPLRNNAPILAYRNYGLDIVDRLTGAGFTRAEVRLSPSFSPWGVSRRVVVAYKSMAPEDSFDHDPAVVHYSDIRQMR